MSYKNAKHNRVLSGYRFKCHFDQRSTAEKRAIYEQLARDMLQNLDETVLKIKLSRSERDAAKKSQG